MVTALAQSLSVNKSTMELSICTTISNRRTNCIPNGHLSKAPRNFRTFLTKNLSHVPKHGDAWASSCPLSPIGSEVPSRKKSVQQGRCGCGAPSQDRKLGSSDRGSQAEIRPLQAPSGMTGKPGRRKARSPTRAGVIADERDVRGVLAAKLRSAFGFKESSLGVESQNVDTTSSGRWRLLSGVAAAGLSLTLYSSALAIPVSSSGPMQVPTTPVTENLRAHVEMQLRRELQAQIKVQKDWLDEIGQPLSQWTIDDRVRNNLEEMSRTRLDESGKTVSKLEMLDSEVVPIFKPPVGAQKKEEANAGIATTTQESSQEKVAAASSRGPPGPVQLRESDTPTTTPITPMTPKPAKPTLEGASEFVAVAAAIPLGKVVSAASRTVGSAASMAAAQASATAVPGVNLLTRIMMHFGGGGVAGAMGATLVYPLDTIKTRMQAQSDKDGEEAVFKNEWDCFSQMVAKEGPGSLYSGLLPQLLGIAPEKAMKLTVNDVLMEILVSELPGVGPWALELIAGGGGGFSQVVFTNPMEIVKVRLQTQSKDTKQKNTWDVIKELGVQGLYNGSAVTMARDIPSSAIFFAIYTLIRQVYPDQSFMAGFVAAIPATVLVTPFDVVKTRIQMERAGGQVPYENGYECFATILQTEGIAALFKGSLARVLKTSPQFGITLMLYNILCSES